MNDCWLLDLLDRRVGIIADGVSVSDWAVDRDVLQLVFRAGIANYNRKPVVSHRLEPVIIIVSYRNLDHNRVDQGLFLVRAASLIEALLVTRDTLGNSELVGVAVVFDLRSIGMVFTIIKRNQLVAHQELGSVREGVATLHSLLDFVKIGTDVQSVARVPQE